MKNFNLTYAKEVLEGIKEYNFFYDHSLNGDKPIVVPDGFSHVLNTDLNSGLFSVYFKSSSIELVLYNKEDWSIMFSFPVNQFIALSFTEQLDRVAESLNQEIIRVSLNDCKDEVANPRKG